MPKDKAIFISIFAVIAVLSDIITLYQFIITGNVFNTWSFNWIIGIIMSVSISALAAFLVKFVMPDTISDLFLSASALIFQIFYVTIISYLASTHISGRIGPGDYFGYIVMLLISTAVGASYAAILRKKLMFRLMSYASFLPAFYIMWLLVKKYVISSHGFHFFPFAGEVFILLIGVGVSCSLLLAGDE